MLPSSGDLLSRGATTTNYLRQYTGWKQLMLKIKQGRERRAILLQRPGETLGGGRELVKEWAMQTPGDTHPRVNAMCLAFFPGGSLVENPLANAGSPRGVGLIPGSNPLEEEMATHSSILAWEILWTEEPGGLQSMGSQSRI